MKKMGFVVMDKSSVYIDKRAKIGENVIIYENNHIEGNCEIGDNVTLLPNNFISNSKVGKGSKIHSSVVEGAEIGSCVTIGPFAHLRVGSKIGSYVKIGNFCEIKNAEIGERTKVSHLSYVGDAVVGKNCNIGCGVIFVNYNGKIKQTTFVEDKVFIGSNVNIIAPVKIGENAYICAGTTISEDVSAGDFVIGRVRPETKPNRAKDYF